MNTIATVARVLLGLVFFVFGWDGLLHVLPLPPMPPRASQVIDVLIGYRLFHVVKALEIAGALLLLSGRFPALATALLAPIIFNIVWFDLNLAPSALPVGLLLVALEAVLVWAQRESFRPLLRRA